MMTLFETQSTRIAAVAATALLFATATSIGPAEAGVPTTTTVEAALTSAGGGAAADGNYLMTFSLYDGKDAKTPSWQESAVKVAVKGGRLSYRLGSAKALDAKLLAGLKAPWFGVSVGADPELARVPLNSVIYAQVAQRLACSGCVSASQIAAGSISAANVGFKYAGSTSKGGAALDLACTGCVSTKEIKFDGDVDFGGNSLKAKNATFTGDIAAGTVTATSFVGNGSKLSGIKIPTGECKTAGEVVKGINADGSLKCVKAMDPSALPSDGLNEVSNNLLTNQFTDAIEASNLMVPIPDNQGTEAISNLTIPDIGVAQGFEISVHVENTDLSKVSIVVLPPNDKKVGWVLCDPCGAKDAKIFKKTFSPKSKPKSGDIGAVVGTNPKGLWNLKVKDTAYCISQAPGNAKYCVPTKKVDGWIATWSAKIQTLSTKKVQANGVFRMPGGTVLQAANKAPAPCNSTTVGYFYYNPVERTLRVCNGKEFDLVETLPGGIGSKGAPGISCKDIKTKDKGAKDGLYWIDPDGKGGSLGKFQAWCDMTTAGGGWMLVMQIQTGHSTYFGYGSSHWTSATTTTTVPPVALSSVNAKYATFNTFKTTDGQILLRDKSTSNYTSLEVPGMKGTTLLNRFQSLGGKKAYNLNQGAALKYLSGKASPQELMGFSAPSNMCSQFKVKWRMNMLSSHSGVRIGNDVATNKLTTNNPSSWKCYDNKTNLSYSGVGGTLESGKQWQDSYGSEALNRYRDNGGTGQGSQNGVEIYVR